MPPNIRKRARYVSSSSTSATRSRSSGSPPSIRLTTSLRPQSSMYGRPIDGVIASFLVSKNARPRLRKTSPPFEFLRPSQLQSCGARLSPSTHRPRQSRNSFRSFSPQPRSRRKPACLKIALVVTPAKGLPWSSDLSSILRKSPTSVSEHCQPSQNPRILSWLRRPRNWRSPLPERPLPTCAPKAVTLRNSRNP